MLSPTILYTFRNKLIADAVVDHRNLGSTQQELLVYRIRFKPMTVSFLELHLPCFLSHMRKDEYAMRWGDALYYDRNRRDFVPKLQVPTIIPFHL
jgi:hypothetical protein